MIELNDIIEAADSLLKDKSLTLVLHRNMKTHPKFKVYKIFEYKLYAVNTSDKTKTILIDKSFTANTPADDIICTWNKYDKEFLPVLIKWFSSEEFTSWI